VVLHIVARVLGLLFSYHHDRAMAEHHGTALPIELWQRIFFFVADLHDPERSWNLPKPELASLMLVCKEWKVIFSSFVGAWDSTYAIRIACSWPGCLFHLFN
jgi:hypothetical protein